ncbi:MAG: hypothetical protein COB12_09820 [Flavobacterium sp.]|nr:MAG: hypothetical protein COB12_09820 [Flavobacterium sp.]
MFGKANISSSTIYNWSISIPVLRYVLGISFIMLVSTLLAYPISYLTPVLALIYIAPGTKPLTFKQGANFIIILVIINTITFIFSSYFKEFPLVFMPLLCLGILWLYYSVKIPIMLKLFAVISILVIPLMSLEPTGVSSIVALSLILNALIAIVLSQLVFKVFPWSEADEDFVKEKQQAAIQTDYQRFCYARNILLILFPVLLLFFIFKLSGGLIILIFIGILSISPALANAKVGKFLIAANILGGLFAIIAYKLLVIVPMIAFMILLVLLVGFIFGSRLFSKAKLAAIFGTGFSTFLLILGTVTSSDDAAAGSAVWERLIQISAAVIYVVTAFAILNYFQKKKLVIND